MFCEYCHTTNKGHELGGGRYSYLNEKGTCINCGAPLKNEYEWMATPQEPHWDTFPTTFVETKTSVDRNHPDYDGIS